MKTAQRLRRQRRFAWRRLAGVGTVAAVGALFSWPAGLGLLALGLGWAWWCVEREFAEVLGEALTGAPHEDLSPRARLVLEPLRAQERVWRRRLEAARRDRERLIAAWDRLPVGVVWLAADGTIRRLNRRAEDLLQLQRRLHGGQPLALFLPEPRWLERIRASGEAGFTGEVPRRGETLHCRLQWVPLEEGEALLLVEDRTEAIRLERMRRDFVANVSHELRTPLTIVRGYVETALDAPTPLPPPLAGYLEQVHAQAVRMQRLVEDLLTLAQLEGTQPPPAKWVDVGELLETAAAQARGVAPEGLTVEVDFPPQPRAILGVRTELESALGNLALNAVRYTPAPGRVVIGARAAENGEGELFVRDTGIGIAPEHLPRLTERFYRVDRARSRDRGGTGLGLAIVNHVAQRHEASRAIVATMSEKPTGAQIAGQMAAAVEKASDGLLAVGYALRQMVMARTGVTS